MKCECCENVWLEIGEYSSYGIFNLIGNYQASIFIFIDVVLLFQNVDDSRNMENKLGFFKNMENKCRKKN